MRSRHLSPLVVVCVLLAPFLAASEPIGAVERDGALVRGASPSGGTSIAGHEASDSLVAEASIDGIQPLLSARRLFRGERSGDQRYSGGRADTRAFSSFGKLRLWAEGGGYVLGRSSSAYDIEGGASYPLLPNMVLTARYRLLGLGASRADSRVQAGLSAPYLGFSLDF